MLSAGRAVAYRDNRQGALGVAAGKHIYEGALVVASGSYAQPGAAGLGLIALGIALSEVDNTAGNDGDAIVQFRKGTFYFMNSANADAVTAADTGKRCYIVDDETVARTSNGNTRSPAGRVVEVDANGVWVDLDPDIRKVFVPLHIADLVAADAKTYGFVSPVKGEITDIRTVLETHALAGGDATLTAKIGGAAVTNGVVTITQAGSAVGDKDEATPSAANAVNVGDYVSITVGGANTDATAVAELMVEISY